jgi:hypothetical protein
MHPQIFLWQAKNNRDVIRARVTNPKYRSTMNTSIFLNASKMSLGAWGIYSPYSQNAGDKVRDILLAR